MKGNKNSDTLFQIQNFRYDGEDFRKLVLIKWLEVTGVSEELVEKIDIETEIDFCNFLETSAVLMKDGRIFKLGRNYLYDLLTECIPDYFKDYGLLACRFWEKENVYPDYELKIEDSIMDFLIIKKQPIETAEQAYNRLLEILEYIEDNDFATIHDSLLYDELKFRDRYSQHLLDFLIENRETKKITRLIYRKRSEDYGKYVSRAFLESLGEDINEEEKELILKFAGSEEPVNSLMKKNMGFDKILKKI